MAIVEHPTARRQTRRPELWCIGLAAAFVLTLPAPSPAAGDALAGAGGAAAAEQEVVSYDVAFFERYQPNTALDIVARIPGFLIDNGADKRGFGAAAGNILINDRYPSAKQEEPSAILERIPAGQVERVDLIRGQVRGIDLRGKSAVVNVILRPDIPASGRWDLILRENLDHHPLTVTAAGSVSDNWRGIEYNTGVFYRHFRSGEAGLQDTFDAARDLLVAQTRQSFLNGDEGSLSLSALGWLGETFISMNGQIAFEDRIEELAAVSLPHSPLLDDSDFFIDDDDSRSLELGIDAERAFAGNMLAKGILLYTRAADNKLSSQTTDDRSDTRILFRVADSEVVESEAIARTELYWSPRPGQSLIMSLEGARNVIDGSLLQTVDTGSGPVHVPVRGGNTRVQEDRLDILINRTISMDKVEISYGLGAETSKIRQAGDAEGERSFSFLKPRFSFAYTPTTNRHMRLRLAREVSQLDFSDFVSSTVFQDDDVAMGNPDLKPEASWVAELSDERRFGSLGALKGTFFYEWISDVQDLLPLSPDFEAPGNIGSGRRFGLRLEATIPLDFLHLTGARVDVEARLQGSEVTDPVTGSARELSGEEEDGKPLEFDVENRFVYGLNYRQDLEDARFAWGGNVRRRGDRTAFRVNELVVYGEGYEFNMFVETTRWLGLKLRLEAANLTDFAQKRKRILFAGERDLSSVDTIELQNITDGRRIVLSASGSY